MYVATICAVGPQTCSHVFAAVEDARVAACQLLLRLTGKANNAWCGLLLQHDAIASLLVVCSGVLEGTSLRAYAARLLAQLVRANPDAAGAVLLQSPDSGAVWRLLGVYEDGLLVASEGVALVSMLLSTGAAARRTLCVWL